MNVGIWNINKNGEIQSVKYLKQKKTVKYNAAYIN
jgi:hypothetical protein